ncbi:hypothetical protein BCR32DRAFT_295634 [Anaeromyces robustus]|uniref:Cation-transporting ATPase n=1 Tax=Anaeromyces robustus TaxID=1754192 RepID=A0A1Y1WV52_9FUNG|nr:hypothetical protein BCR32DRAFT_295634 [Anaeromyces robustus]|eukprot:ORX77383.1 hypothetical protein BCR32DRAFT_295634 [Anaeromyces robustus]
MDINKDKNPKQQKVLLEDDLIITINGYKQVPVKRLIYYILCICSLGTLFLLLHWFPKWKLKLLGVTVPIEDAPELFIENSWTSSIIHVKVRHAIFNGKISDIFTKYRNKGLKKMITEQSKKEKNNLKKNVINIDANDEKLLTMDQFEEANAEKKLELRFFIYQYIRFIYNPISKTYEPIINWKDPEWTSVCSVINGLESEEVHTQRQRIFGINVAEIQQKSTLSFLLDEILHPFYIFQVFSIILWCTEDYYYYAVCILLMSVWSVFTVLKTSKENLKKISEMSRFTCPVVVYRNYENDNVNSVTNTDKNKKKSGKGKDKNQNNNGTEQDQDSPFKHIDSSELVPGDVLVIAPDELETLPCDAIILKGDCIVNESMLTGESMPVNKIPIKDEELRNLDFEKDDDIITNLGNCCLFAGTNIVRVRSDLNQNKNKMLAINEENENEEDNYSTFTLIDQQQQNNEEIVSYSNIINKKLRNEGENCSVSSLTLVGPRRKRNVKYESKSAYALVIRTGFNTAKGSLVRSMLFPKENFFQFYRDSFKFIFVLAILAFVGFGASIFNFIKYGVPLSIMITRALDLITVVVPPALPATMSIGTSFAISQLKKLKIFCISPNRVIVGGKLNLICFDKTGTLTENGLCVLGVHHIEQSKQKKLIGTQDITKSQISQELQPLTQQNTQLLNTSNDVKVKFSNLTNHSSKNQTFFSPSYSAEIIKSVSQIRENSSISDTEKSSIISKRYIDLLRYAMATCHNVKVIDDKFIGDPLDIEMFKFINWSLEENDGSIEGLTTIVRPNKSNLENNDDHQNEVKINISSENEMININNKNENIIDSIYNNSSKELIELGIVRVFEFISNLRRMSVIIRRMYNKESKEVVSDNLEVFVKGAPEVIRSLSRKDTVPGDFNQKLHRLVNKGYRVIAVGYKTMDNIKYHKLMKMKREEVECDLEFLGFVIFENPLKPGTTKTINALNEATIRSLMCTGDNILTGISVARECNMIDKDACVKILKFVKGSGEPDASSNSGSIYGGRTSTAKIYLDEHIITPEETTPEVSKIEPSKPQIINENSESDSESSSETNSDDSDDSDSEDCIAKDDKKTMLFSKDSSSPEKQETSEKVFGNESIIKIDNEIYAMTGDIFDWILHNYSEEQVNSILKQCKVFARMLPDQKQLLVEKFQEMGYCVSFCGDGANDCGALKSADVGLSLSETEASVAAPFTSRETDLKCVLNVIKEGRAALVTNFSCFKYMAIYSLIQFTTVSLLYSLAANLGDAQYLFIDLFLIIPIAVAMGRAHSYHKIHHKAPSANLISFKVLVSLLGQVAIQMAFQFYIFFWTRKQPWYEASDDTSGELVLCYENTTLFYVSCFQYILGAIVFSVGPPYRQSVYKNFLFVLLSALATILVVVMLFLPENPFLDFMELLVLPLSGKIYTLVVMIINGIVSVAAEMFLWPNIIYLIKGKRD